MLKQTRVLLGFEEIHAAIEDYLACRGLWVASIQLVVDVGGEEITLENVGDIDDEAAAEDPTAVAALVILNTEGDV